MDHQMRRPERGVSEVETRQLLEQGEYGILSCGRFSCAGIKAVNVRDLGWVEGS